MPETTDVLDIQAADASGTPWEDVLSDILTEDPDASLALFGFDTVFPLRDFNVSSGGGGCCTPCSQSGPGITDCFCG
jgi:hypothetical protein